MAVETVPFDAAEHLGSFDAQVELLSDAFATGDRAYIANALGVVARARGMSGIAKEAGVSREALYRSLSKDGDPRLSTVIGVITAMGMKLKTEPAEKEPADA